MNNIFKTHNSNSYFKQWVEIATHSENLTMEISRDTNLVVRFYDTQKRLKYFVDYNNQTFKEYIHVDINYCRVLAEFVKLYHRDEDIREITTRIDEGYTYTCKENDWIDTIQGNSIERLYNDNTIYKRIYIKQ